jgi:hypothetical protein
MILFRCAQFAATRLEKLIANGRGDFSSLGGRSFSPDVKLRREPALAAEESSCWFKDGAAN